MNPFHAMPTQGEQQIARYETSIARLKNVCTHHQRREGMYLICFAALVGSGLACFAYSNLAGIWATLSASLVSFAGYAMYKFRLWELESEIQETRDEIIRIRSTQTPS
jgi:hypothetical protein